MGPLSQWVALKPGSGEGKRCPKGPFCHVGAPAGTSETLKEFDKLKTLFKHLDKQNLVKQVYANCNKFSL